MTLKQSPLSTLVVGLLLGLMVYLAIYTRIDGTSNYPAFSSRSLMNHGATANSASDIVSNPAVTNAIDQIITSVGLTNSTEFTVKAISDDIAKLVAEYMIHKFGQSAVSSQPQQQQRYISTYNNSNADLPVIYVVTPTYRRSEQIPELTRMAQTLLNVAAIHWIVVEDSTSLSPAVAHLLQRYGIPYTHLNAQMPDKYKKLKTKPRGVSNRNAALRWVRQNQKSGVLYFADDDNTYDIRLFEEMRYTKKVSMWPVGLVTSLGLSSPVVNKDGVVVDFYDGWIANRKFPVDMAGFAVSVQLLLDKDNAYMPFVPGHEEDGFLKSLGITNADIEAKANRCTQVRFNFLP